MRCYLAVVLVAVAIDGAYSAIIELSVGAGPGECVDSSGVQVTGCRIPVISRIIGFDQSYYPPIGCAKYTCRKNGTAYLETCDITNLPLRCGPLVGEKRFPNCCEQVLC